jgi:hypothetical protein
MGCYPSLSPGNSGAIKVHDTSYTRRGEGVGVGAAAVPAPAGQEQSNQHHCEYYSSSTISTATVVNAAAGSLQNTSPRSFSYTTSTVHTGMTHSIQKVMRVI